MIKSKKIKFISIIGKGNVGKALEYEFKKSRAYKVAVAAYNSEDYIKPEIINKSDIVFICTQDRNISKVVKELRKDIYNLKGKFVYHTSGCLDSGELKQLRRKGALIGSFHPIQTFANSQERNMFRNIYIALEGQSKAVSNAMKLTKEFKAKNIILKSKNKVNHHINCVLASNFIPVLFAEIEKNNRKNLTPYRRLAEKTLENIFTKGAASALTGPIERFDLDTIITHLKYLKKNNKALLKFYLFMGIETAKLALTKKSISEKQMLELILIFRKYSLVS